MARLFHANDPGNHTSRYIRKLKGDSRRFCRGIFAAPIGTRDGRPCSTVQLLGLGSSGVVRGDNFTLRK